MPSERRDRAGCADGAGRRRQHAAAAQPDASPAPRPAERASGRVSGSGPAGARRGARADDHVIFFGEDVAIAGGVFAVTQGLYEKYGRERVFDTPISELALTGAAYGAAITGKRPVLEIMFGDFLALSMDVLINQATKYWFLSGGRRSVPLVIRSVVGAGGRFGAIHSQMPISWLMGISGLKIVAPSNPADASRAPPGGDPRRESGRLLRAQAALLAEGADRRRAPPSSAGARRAQGPGCHARERDEGRPRLPRRRRRARSERCRGRGDRPPDDPPDRHRDGHRVGRKTHRIAMVEEGRSPAAGPARCSRSSPSRGLDELDDAWRMPRRTRRSRTARRSRTRSSRPWQDRGRGQGAARRQRLNSSLLSDQMPRICFFFASNSSSVIRPCPLSAAYFWICAASSSSAGAAGAAGCAAADC